MHGPGCGCMTIVMTTIDMDEPAAIFALLVERLCSDAEMYKYISPMTGRQAGPRPGADSWPGKV